jgi:hypothetical protein
MTSVFLRDYTPYSLFWLLARLWLQPISANTRHKQSIARRCYASEQRHHQLLLVIIGITGWCQSRTEQIDHVIAGLARVAVAWGGSSNGFSEDLNIPVMILVVGALQTQRLNDRGEPRRAAGECARSKPAWSIPGP